MTRIARCCCQACRIEVEGEPTMNAVCNCASCKRRTGSAFGWSVYFRNEDIRERRGDLTVYLVAGPPEGRRWFCSRCGTTLSWDGGDQTGFAGGCFVDTPLPEPNITSHYDRRFAWVALPDGWMRISH